MQEVTQLHVFIKTHRNVISNVLHLVYGGDYMNRCTCENSLDDATNEVNCT